MSQFKTRFAIPAAVFVVALAVYLFTIRAVPLAIFASGFAASSLEVVLLLGFQILYGSVYQQLGIIITVFMTGLAVGAWVGNRGLARNDANPHPDSAHGPRNVEPTPSPSQEGNSGVRIPSSGGVGGGFGLIRDCKAIVQVQNDKQLRRNMLAILAFAIAALSALLPFVLTALGRLGGATSAFVVVQATIAMLTFILAMLVGMEFPVASQAESGHVASTASRLYTADFIGASLGALMASTFLIPLMGVTTACLLTAALNVIGGAVVLLRKG